MIDSEGRIVLVNKEIERLFGYSRDELLGNPVEMLVPERFRLQHRNSAADFSQPPPRERWGRDASSLDAKKRAPRFLSKSG